MAQECRCIIQYHHDKGDQGSCVLEEGSTVKGVNIGMSARMMVEQLVSLLVSRRSAWPRGSKYSGRKLVMGLALWRQTMQSYNVNREMMVFLISCNCNGVVELLLRMLEKKKGREEEGEEGLGLGI